MIRKKELLAMKERLKVLIEKYDTLYKIHEPKKHFFGIFGSGDLHMASQMLNHKICLRIQIRMIDWMLQKEIGSGYEEYDVKILEECAEEWLDEWRNNGS